MDTTEQALDDAGKAPKIAVYSKVRGPAPALPTPEETKPVLIKLHGDILQGESVVITDEDYIDFVLRMNDPLDMNPLPLDVLFYLKKYTTLFVGYRLMDYNLRVLFRAMRWKMDPGDRPNTYSLDPSPDPLILDVWWNQRRYVKFIIEDSWMFVPALYRAVLGRDFAP